MRLFVLACLMAAMFCLGVTPAFAHAHLRASSPAAESTGPAQTEISVTFSEALEPKFSTVTVTDGAGARMDVGDVAVVGGNAKIVAVKVKPLAPGTYTVNWHATSVDTHKTEGSFRFSVAP
jgi:methionine-rich copper-binding protein CopC